MTKFIYYSICRNFGFMEEFALENSKKSMDTIVALAKGRGFVYPGSEIYGGLANSRDYGPMGVEQKNNIKRTSLKKFVH